MLGTFVLSSGYYDAYYSKAQRMRRLIVDKTNEIVNNFISKFIDYNKTSDYSALLNVNRQRRFMNNYNNTNRGNDWFK